MDLHDYKDVANNYDLYITSLVGIEQNQQCINFHLELAEKYGKEGILDVACGTGITMIPLVEAGYKTIGFDLSDEMVKITNNKLSSLPIEDQKRANVFASNMTNFELNNKVSLAIIPRTGFAHLTTQKEQIKTLKNINKYLTPNGVLSLNNLYPNYERIVRYAKGKSIEPRFCFSYTNSNSNTEDLYEIMEYDYETQLMKGKWIFIEKDNNNNEINRRERPLKMRWTFKPEMELLFEMCGFKVLEIYGYYDKRNLQYGSNIVWVLKKVSECDET